MHEAVRNVEAARTIARRPAPPAGTSPPLLGVPQSRRAPLPPPRRVDPREAFRAAKAPASTRAREPYLIGIAAFAAAGATALALLSSGAVGLPFRSPAPAIAEAGLSVTAVDLAREARELRELSRAAAAAAAATAPAADRNSKESGPAPSSPSQQTSDQSSSPGAGEIAGDEDDPTPLDDSTALLEDSANELGGAANQLLEDSTTLLEDTTQLVLEEAESLELDPSLPDRGGRGEGGGPEDRGRLLWWRAGRARLTGRGRFSLPDRCGWDPGASSAEKEAARAENLCAVGTP